MPRSPVTPAASGTGWRPYVLGAVLALAVVAGTLSVTLASAASPWDVGCLTCVHESLQGAIDALPPEQAATTVITLHPGVYNERVVVPQSHAGLTIVAESPGRSFIRGALSKSSLPDGVRTHPASTATLSVFADDVTLRDLVIENVAGRGSQVGPATALAVQGDGVFVHGCTIRGSQDVLCTGNRGLRQAYLGCTIEGDVDIIYGDARAWFSDCTIRSIDPGVIAAHYRPVPHYRSSLVFDRCDLVGEGPSLLGRAWGPFASVTFQRSVLGSHIDARGWRAFKPEWEGTARLVEALNSGPGSGAKGRVAWALRTDEIVRMTDHLAPTGAGRSAAEDGLIRRVTAASPR